MTSPSATRILGYVDKLVVHDGERLAVKLSTAQPQTCRAEVVRLTCADPDPRGPGLRAARVEAIAPAECLTGHQPIHPGSYLRVEAAPPLASARAFAFTAMLWPTAPGGRVQTIASLWDDRACHGWAIGLDAAGALALRVADGRGADVLLSTGVPLLERHWSHVCVRFDGETGLVELHHAALSLHPGCTTSAEWRGVSGVTIARMPDQPMFLAARAGRDDAGRDRIGEVFDGKIGRPRLTRADLPFADLRRLVDRDDVAAHADAILAAWDFAHAIPTRDVRDVGPHGLHAISVNCPARGVTGHDWDGSSIDWRHTPQHYAAIHFHADDLYDCGWKTDVTFALPPGLRSGFHAVRVTAPGCETFLPFFVSPRPGQATAQVAVLAATATYLAYANTHVKVDSLNSENLFESVMQICEQEAYLNTHRELGYSTYDVHQDGSGVFYSSWLRPLLTMQPGLYTFNYVNDTHVLAWLEASGQPYDVITDHDLHHHGREILDGYRVLITCSHPEYFTTGMWDALDGWQQQGGRHMYLGGNGFYWRTAISPAFPAAIEMRRGITGVRTWEGEPGEDQLSFSGEPGGLWRSVGRAPQRLCGVGFCATIFNRSTHYRRSAAGRHPDFDFVFAGVPDDTRIGAHGLRGGGAAGLEIDRWDVGLGSPPDGVVIASSENVGIGGLLSVEEFITTTRALDAEQNGKVRADMCLFATPQGGAVFSVGSIAWPTSLWRGGYDNDVARITANVLTRFLDPAPLPTRRL